MTASLDKAARKLDPYTVEECAKVAEGHSPPDFTAEGMRAGVAAAIRSLLTDARPAHKDGDPCPHCKRPYSNGDTCPAHMGGCPMGGDF